MADLNVELQKWFEKLQKIPTDYHLLCPRTGDEDDENYKKPNDPASKITPEEKLQRIEQGKERVEITYWNSLIFGFEKKEAGKWLEDFTIRLEECLKSCSECVLNWHMNRKHQMQQFSEYVPRILLP